MRQIKPFCETYDTIQLRQGSGARACAAPRTTTSSSGGGEAVALLVTKEFDAVVPPALAGTANGDTKWELELEEVAWNAVSLTFDDNLSHHDMLCYHPLHAGLRTVEVRRPAGRQPA